MKQLPKNILTLFVVLVIAQSCTTKMDTGKDTTPGYLPQPTSKDHYELIFDHGTYHLFYGEGQHALSNDLLHWKSGKKTTLGNEALAYSATNISGVPCAIEVKQNHHFSFFTKNPSKQNFWEKLPGEIDITNIPENILDLSLFSQPSDSLFHLALLSDQAVWFYQSENKTEWIYNGQTKLSALPAKEDWKEIDIEFIPDDKQVFNAVLFLSQQKSSPNGAGAVAYFAGDFIDGVFEKSSNKNGWIHFGSDYEHLAITSSIVSNTRRVVGVGKVVGLQPENGMAEKTLLTMPDEFIMETQLGYPFLKTRPLTTDFTHTDLWKSENLEVEGSMVVDQRLETPVAMTLKYDMNNRKYLDFAEAFGIQLSDGERTLKLGYQNFKRYFFIQYAKHKESTDKMRPYFAPYIFDQNTLVIEITLFEEYVKLSALDGAVCLTRVLEQGFEPQSLILFSEKGKSKLTEITIKKLNYNLN